MDNIQNVDEKIENLSDSVSNLMDNSSNLTEEQLKTLNSIKAFTESMTTIMKDVKAVVDDIDQRSKESMINENYSDIKITDLEVENFERPKMLSPLNLAFIGDAVYEILVRQMLLKNGSMPQGKLHNKSTSLVCAKAQSNAYNVIADELTEEETAIFKRGRNSATAGVPKHSDPIEYRRATGIETLFGYLYLTQQNDRMIELFNIIMNNTNM